MEKKNSILIVDDDPSNLMELIHILKEDYKIRSVKDGMSALENANEFLPDIILLDVIMPDMSGFEVIAEFKKQERTKSIPVIFITGMKDAVNESEGLAIGAVDYIRKPFDATVVKLRVGQQLKIVNLQRELESALEAAESAAEIAEAANKSKSSFLANMSHEIRTPMNAIMGITDILMQNETLSDEIAEGLDKVYASSEMLIGIINDILDFSKIEAGKLDILPATYQVASMVNDAIHLNMMRIGNRPIEFELNITDDIPAKLIGDELRIKQILNNILSNAFKYTSAGKVSLSIIANRESDGKNANLVLVVKDTGHGMTKEQLDKMFDEYSRFNENSTRSIEGTGLGLSITQRLVNLMHGELQVESEPNVGTTVTIRLPQETINDEVLGKDVAENLRRFRQSNSSYREKNKFKREPMPYGKVLIVDDTETNIFVAEKLMKPYKLNVETAISGREAVDKCIDGKIYDIIFMDHMMPEMDGMEATKLLRDKGYCGTIVALTANAMTGQAEIFLAGGFDEFISKPIDTRELDRVLNKHIKDKQSPETIKAAQEQNGSAHDAHDTIGAMEPLLIESATRDTKKAIDTLEEFCKNSKADDDNELRNFATVVHGMKSSLGNIGEPQLSQIASDLEDAARDKNIGFIEQTTPGFVEGLKQLLQKLELRQEATDDGDDITDLRESLIAFKAMCAEYNRKGTLDTLSGIIRHFDKKKKAFENVKEHILLSDFEEAESAVEAFLAELEK
ncbi:MAG: response regulator [Oscillospiraceae bacterium]|nr:response regulator [Oscillospiraceae bacterium]